MKKKTILWDFNALIKQTFEKSQLDSIELHGVYFDGRKDNKQVKECFGSKMFLWSIKHQTFEKHHCTIKEPD